MNLSIARTLLPEGDDTSESILPLLRTLIGSSLSFVGLSEEALDKVVITDEAGFGPAVHELQRDVGHTLSFTDNDIHKAVAKTIPNFQDERLVNSIVVRDFIIAEVAMAAQASNDFTQWNENGQFCFYIFTHEVGHCKDNILRPGQEETPIHVGGIFRVRQIAKYYFSILMGEFAACVHSAGALTDGVHLGHIKEWRSDIETFLTMARRQVDEYQRDNSKLRDLAFNSAQAFWVIILQYAKIIGSMIGNPDLDQTPPTWITDDAEVGAMLTELTAALHELWNEYPTWSDSHMEKFFSLWKRLALVHGYDFVEGEADGLFLKREKFVGR